MYCSLQTQCVPYEVRLNNVIMLHKWNYISSCPSQFKSLPSSEFTQHSTAWRSSRCWQHCTTVVKYAAGASQSCCRIYGSQYWLLAGDVKQCKIFRKFSKFPFLTTISARIFLCLKTTKNRHALFKIVLWQIFLGHKLLWSVRVCDTLHPHYTYSVILHMQL